MEVRNEICCDEGMIMGQLGSLWYDAEPRNSM
jgi:hypothetical protein